MSEYDFIKWVIGFAELSLEAGSDMRRRMDLLKRLSTKRLDELIQKIQKDLEEASDE